MAQIKRGRVMTEAKHTPGPWRVEQDTTLIWGNCDPHDTATSGMGLPIAEARLNNAGGIMSGRAIGYEEAEANAHLIAAAPELLEALEALNATIDAFWNDPSQSKSRPSERHMKAITLAQVESYKAVVKARGEAQ